MAHKLAGTPVQEQDIIDVQTLVDAYFDNAPDVTDPTQLVSFGTSGHRGTSLNGTFTDLHVAAITQAICDGRGQFGATGPIFVGQDTHALSQPALVTVLEVLAGNGVTAMVDADMDFVPTPSVSRAIIRYNESNDKKADGIVITPSHNPPDNGGIKYNATNGGPADTLITKWIETRANEYVRAYCELEGFKRISIDNIEPDQQVPYDYKGLYVEELSSIINMEAIQSAKPKVLVNALGGSGLGYWRAIKERYNLNMDIINDEYDPTFSFMTYDHDGKVRMDCSSEYAMADVTKQIGNYDLAVGNDPDYDRYGIVTVWTTDKDGMVMALLAMEMYAVMGATVDRLYNNIVEGCGDPRFGRIDAACTKAAKAKLKQLNASSITATEVDGDAITNIRTTSLYKDMPIDGVRVETETGWFVARPSGTEDLYKIYGESYKGDKGLVALLTAGEAIVTAALSDEV